MTGAWIELHIADDMWIEKLLWISIIARSVFIRNLRSDRATRTRTERGMWWMSGRSRIDFVKLTDGLAPITVQPNDRGMCKFW